MLERDSELQGVLKKWRFCMVVAEKLLCVKPIAPKIQPCVCILRPNSSVCHQIWQVHNIIFVAVRVASDFPVLDILRRHSSDMDCAFHIFKRLELAG